MPKDSDNSRIRAIAPGSLPAHPPRRHPAPNDASSGYRQDLGKPADAPPRRLPLRVSTSAQRFLRASFRRSPLIARSTVRGIPTSGNSRQVAELSLPDDPDVWLPLA